MPVRNDKTRIIFTLSKKQNEWLESMSKKLKMSKSRLIRLMLSKNIANFLALMPKDQLDNIIKIAHTPWLDDEDED